MSLHSPDQALRVVIEAGVADLDGIASGQLRDVGRQVRGLGYAGAFDQGGDDELIAGERFADLGFDEVVRMVELAVAVGVSGGEPVLANDRDQRVAGRDLIGDDFREVRAGHERVQISEYVLASELSA